MKSSWTHFWHGFASAFIIWPYQNLNKLKRKYQNESPTAGFVADAKALSGDWQRVGQDMRNAMKEIDKEIENKKRTCLCQD